MKAYKIEVLVIDHENVGEENIKDAIENVRYINARVKSIESADIGDWDDDHPLNKRATADAEYERLFSPPKSKEQNYGKTMDKKEAEEYGYAVEKYADGFILCDYSGKRGKFGAAYLGKFGDWKSQPLGLIPFLTEEKAWEAAI